MTCKDCIHCGLCYKENDYDNFPDRCGDFVSDKVLEERPQGEWEHIPDDTNKQRIVYKCSECGRIIDVYYREDLSFAYPFCHCGADMRKGEEE